MHSILLICDAKPKIGDLTKSYIDAFMENGCNVDIVFPDVFCDFLGINEFFEIAIGRLNNIFTIQQKTLEMKINKFIESKKYDLIFVMKGYYLDVKFLTYIKNKNNILVCFNADDPFNVNNSSSKHNILDAVSIYDVYFIWSKKIQEKIKKDLNPNCYYIPFAVDAKLHKPMTTQNKIYDISFIGNWDKEREKWLEFLESKDKLHIFGVNMKRKLKNSELRQRCKNFAPIGDDFCSVVAQTNINLNILRIQNKTSHNMRSFEVPGCGGFLLHEYSEEINEFFEEGKEMEFYRTRSELNDKIRFYSNNSEVTEKIGINAYLKVKSARYTYDNNVKTIIKYIKD